MAATSADGATGTTSPRLAACLRVLEAQAVVVDRLDRAFDAAHESSLAQFLLLRALAAMPGARGRRIDLAAALGMTSSGVTRALVPLEDADLVARETSDRDGRVTYARLTDRGRQRLTAMEATAERTATELLAPPTWTRSHVSGLDALLFRLLRG